MCFTSENPAAIENTFIGLFWILCVTLKPLILIVLSTFLCVQCWQLIAENVILCIDIILPNMGSQL